MPWHSRHDGPLLKRLRIRLFGLTERESAENMQELGRMQAEAARSQAVEDAEDEALVDELLLADERRKTCGLCFTDGWVADDIYTVKRCNEEEVERFRLRLGNPTGRMACPRCRPDWQPRKPPKT